MNILVYNAYYKPEIAAGIDLEVDLAEGFADHGNHVIMYVPTPSRGISEEIRRDYRKKRIEYHCNSHLMIRRYKLIKEGKNPLLRAFRYFVQNAIQFYHGINTKDVDIIFAGSTPPTQGAMCSMVKKVMTIKRHREIPFVYNLQDVFPDSLVNAGMTKKGSFLWKIGRLLEDYTYKNANKIIVISDCFKQNLLKKGVPESKITVVSNWIDLAAIHPVSKMDNTLFDEYGLDKSSFIVSYAGNFGKTQGAMIIIQAAEILKNYNEIEFVIFGGGTEFQKAREYINENRLNNVFIHELLPSSRLSEIYSIGDVSLITGQAGVGKAGMPSKTWSIMACNTPIIASFDTGSDLDAVLQESKAGYCIKPGDAELLAETILHFRNSNKIKNNSREYVEKHASKNFCVNQYIEALERAVFTGDKR